MERRNKAVFLHYAASGKEPPVYRGADDHQLDAPRFRILLFPDKRRTGHGDGNGCGQAV